MIDIKDTLAHIVHKTGLLIDHHTHVIHVPDTNPDLTPETKTSKKHTFSYRPPSSPRDSRYSRFRSHSNTRNKVKIFQPQSSTDPLNFEIHMHHQTKINRTNDPDMKFHCSWIVALQFLY